MKSVYCAVRTAYLNKAVCASSLKVKLKISLKFSGKSRRFLVALCRNGVEGIKKEAASPQKVSANQRHSEQRK